MGDARDFDATLTLLFIILFGTASLLSGLLMWSDTGEELRRSEDSVWSAQPVQDLLLPVFAVSTVLTVAVILGFVWTEWQRQQR